MSIFGNAKKAELKKEALDTKNWISDKELEEIFFEDNNIIDDLNNLIKSSAKSDNSLSVNTNVEFNKAEAIELKVA